MELDFRLLFPDDFLTGLLDEGLREDGRRIDQARTATINTGSISTANGSSLVKIGNTCAMCGIQAELCNPPQMSPNEGYIVLNVDYSPVATGGKVIKEMSSTFVSQTIQDILLSSKFIDLYQLCILEGQLCWALYIDVILLSIDGPPLDVCLLAIVAGLKDVKLPTVTIESESPVVSMATQTPLHCSSLPVSVSFAIHHKWSSLLDPTGGEMSLCSGLVSIVVTDNNMLAGVYKLGGIALNYEEIEKCIKISKKQGKALSKLITTTINNIIN